MSEVTGKPLRLRDQLIRSFIGVGALRALSMPVSIVVSIILARSLGPDGFGQYAFVMALVPLLALPVAGGLPALLTREVAKCVNRESWDVYRGVIRFSIVRILGYSALLIAGVWGYFFFRPAAELGAKWHLLSIAILLVPLSGFMAMTKGATKGLGHVAISELPQQFVRPFAFLVVVAIILLSGQLSPATAVGGQVFVTAASVALGAWLLVRRRPPQARTAALASSTKNWNRALIPLTLVAIVSTLNAQIATILLGLLETNEAVAAFRVASSGAGLVSVSLSLVNLVIAPQIVKFRLADDRGKLQQLSLQSARAAFAIAAPVAIAYFVAGEPILRTLFGDEYAQAALWPLVILAGGYLFSVFMGSVGLLLIMSDFESDTLRSQIVALAVNVAACAALIPFYGAVGAALGTAIGLLTWNVLMAIKVKRRLGIRPTAL